VSFINKAYSLTLRKVNISLGKRLIIKKITATIFINKIIHFIRDIYISLRYLKSYITDMPYFFILCHYCVTYALLI